MGVEDDDLPKITCIVDLTSETPTATWNDEKDAVMDVEMIDQACDCPELRVPYSAGTGLFCEDETAIDETNARDSTVTKGSTYILTCDAHFVSELTCKFKEDGEGVAWYSDMEYFGPEVIANNCISCSLDACETETEEPTEPTETETETDSPEQTDPVF